MLKNSVGRESEGQIWYFDRILEDLDGIEPREWSPDGVQHFLSLVQIGPGLGFIIY